MKEITPNLWFDGNAKEAVEFYLSAKLLALHTTPPKTYSTSKSRLLAKN
jgi:predicted 3-demethylubiquinone-9 3-methyltransferase (glyoxalase superfamily)